MVSFLLLFIMTSLSSVVLAHGVVFDDFSRWTAFTYFAVCLFAHRRVKAEPGLEENLLSILFLLLGAFPAIVVAVEICHIIKGLF